ncbi:aminotransferase class I/II-fold pyridoxal phosphate-dependent enzyme [Lewinella sp. LCG006]|uniref:aminotransferase class I/II-fold pyridoxal phosphate-dependent enzyme n=1 Tax=Lewinella sp. LCG006 TaxID=3231911 RepID=UPI003460BD82
MTDQTNSLSTRGRALAENPARIDFELFMDANQNLYCPDSNPEGAFPLNVAENTLSSSTIKAQLATILQQNEMPDWVLNYTDLLGHPEVRAQVALFMERYLCKCPIAADTIGFSAGASAIIEVSSFVLANPGDVVVIPAPSYPMYTNDLGLKSGMERYDLQTHYELTEMGSEAPVQPADLDKAWAALEAQGKCFKILLITSPDNPTGCRYTKQQLWELADWCMAHKVHLIVNEIYGLSLIDTQEKDLQKDYQATSSYASFATIMHEAKSDYLHLWYAFSKDFAMSGLRFGVVHSLNAAFMTGLGNLNIPHLVSNITQWMVGVMLSDAAFMESYIQGNKARLTQSYKLVVSALRKMEVPYVPARGSLFVWADFSKFLKENSDKGQEALWVDIYKNTGVLLTPGSGFQHQKKGLFRIVYTAVPLAHLEVAMDRMTSYLPTLI